MQSRRSRRHQVTSFVAVLAAVSGIMACSDKPPTAVTAPSLDGALSFDRSEDTHTRYVSPSGADVGNCRASAPCRTISYAVSRANPGDEISVAKGTYHETVTITKRLELEGHNATIDAAGLATPPNGVVIAGPAADGASLRGFTVRNAGLEGIFVNKTSHITIEKNTVVNNDAYGPFNPLCVNEPDDCGEAIHLQTVTRSLVRDNLVQNNVGGILLTDEDGPTYGVVIEHNRVLDNTKDCGITLASHHFSPAMPPVPATADVAGIYHNIVRHNIANGNGAAGIGVFAGPPGAAAWGNTVVDNVTKNNGFAGVMIHSHTPGQYVDKNIIVGNTIANNGADDDNPFSDAPTGISIFSAVIPIPYTLVAENRIADEHYGINIVNAKKVAGLRTNHFARSVAVPVVRHCTVPNAGCS